MIVLTIAGQVRPLKQVTLRRTADAAELSMQLVGPQVLAPGAAVSLAISGGPTITGTVTESTTSDSISLATATIAPASGSGVYAPERVHFRSTGTVRGDLDFAILPGDTHNGIEIAEVTHTIGTESPAFTEVRF